MSTAHLDLPLDVPAGIPEHDRNDLLAVRSLTIQMRRHEQEVVDAAKQRRRLLRSMRNRRVPFRILAEATGTTEQAIYKDIRWGKE